MLLEHMVAVLSLDDQMDAGDSMDLEGYRVAVAVVHPANLVLEAFLEVEVRIVDSNIAGLPEHRHRSDSWERRPRVVEGLLTLLAGRLIRDGRGFCCGILFPVFEQWDCQSEDKNL